MKDKGQKYKDNVIKRIAGAKSLNNRPADRLNTGSARHAANCMINPGLLPKERVKGKTGCFLQAVLKGLTCCKITE
jgi:hypothetical protein